jgi:hypothetical protein
VSPSRLQTFLIEYVRLLVIATSDASDAKIVDLETITEIARMMAKLMVHAADGVGLRSRASLLTGNVAEDPGLVGGSEGCRGDDDGRDQNCSDGGEMENTHNETKVW